MHRVWTLIGSALFLVIAPGSVAILVPWWISGWTRHPAFLGLEAIRDIGLGLVIVGALPLLDSFLRFALEGLGTPAPIAPPQNLVVSGFYRYVRNPMYVGVLAAILGQSLFFADARILLYVATVGTAFHLFVISYEEPTLRHQFGDTYDIFCANVPRWLPRLTPWRQVGASEGASTR